VAAHRLGLNVLGIEFDNAACQTRRAAGFPTLEADVTDIDPLDYRGVRGLIASPPCQTFSTAGKGAGRQALDQVLAAIDEVMAGRDPWQHIHIDDVRTKLVLIPLQWALALAPDWIAWEQVPTVLPVWEACAEALRTAGYNVVTGNVQAEQYGVPQTRKRAILVARRSVMHGMATEAHLPEPTHTKYRKGKPRQDDGLLPWVSMADALGWGMTARPYPVIASSRSTGGPDKEKVGGSAARRAIYDELDAGRWAGCVECGNDDPTEGYDKCLDCLEATEPTRTAFTELGQQQTFKADVADHKDWVDERPATTVAGRDLVPDPGANANRFNGATKSRNDGVRVTVQQAALLQSFPSDHPWQGTKTKQFQQVGNAIPPLLAERVILAALGIPHANAVQAWHIARGITA
jgi:DNA (cytosine-5)-methyltransferase 1